MEYIHFTGRVGVGIDASVGIITQDESPLSSTVRENPSPDAALNPSMSVPIFRVS